MLIRDILIYSVQILLKIHYLTMSFGYGGGDIIAISALAIKVYTAYKDAPDDYRYIAEEVIALQILIDKVSQHFKSTTIGSSDCDDGQKVLKGCQSVLEDLNSLIEKYKVLASTNKRQVFKRVKLGKEDIATLRQRLISNTGLLNGFVRRFVILAIPHLQYTNISTLVANKIGRAHV